MFEEAAVAGLVTAVAAGAVGGFVGGALTGRTTAAGRFEHRAALAGLLVILNITAWQGGQRDPRPTAHGPG